MARTALAALLAGTVALGQSTKPSPPKVVLVGDSIRLGYAPLVAKLLEGQAAVVSPPGAGDSAWLLKNLDALVLDHKPDLVHLNVGLHDLRRDRKAKALQVDLPDYERNLDKVLARLKGTGATTLFATTTPIDDARHARRGFDRFEKDVARYNEAALRAARKHGVVAHDLHHLVRHAGPDRLLLADGTHYNDAGKRLQAEAVADCVLRHLALRASKAGTVPTADPTDTARYRKAEAERDALVPAAFKKLPVGKFEPPATAEEWHKRRPKVREIVVSSLGDLPPRPRPSARLVSREIHPHFALESLTIPNGVDGEMTAFLLLPHTGVRPLPAILWLHSSSHDRTQMLKRGHNGGDEPLGEVFAKRGYAVFAPDACWYGGRAGAGPSGQAEAAREQHESLFKYNLWFGRTLWGMFVRDDQVALDYLCTRAEIDAKRIGATGISMGSTRSWWLAAVDDRVACAVGVACLTRYQNMLAHGQLRQHGVYYYVNGLLKHFDSEAVVALIAPRPFLALTGELDAGSPADGVRAIEGQAGRVYSVLGAKDRFRSVLYQDTGHVYTADMRQRMLAWFDRWLEPGKGKGGTKRQVRGGVTVAPAG
ncbi:MAG: GDSL-type esterase/lipase family protein [Gemmataceae bacterium]